MITVIAGVNGGGKSSIVGELIRSENSHYINPDELTRAIMAREDHPSEDQANAEAWDISFMMLCDAINNDENYHFETTLGGESVFQELIRAISLGRIVRIFFVGLSTP